ncbi:RNA dependent RNA polymerase-domain-containing protein [Zychaea mexicana]|uniref:RNA dependent RNA polymerase-domain-containing protein n=1 Tax=Zychaea mexicana TaxID=64656 RepID=UPI0022FE623E|nr:RNA dependent RNA polymerase-domain-containing protein [Zychaea mexicana]KAI9495484.1 RNA dependent RNA polymerase-domain-containing protein [Zychaea mexicana]
MVNSMNNMLSNPTNATKLICQNMDEHGNASTMARIISSGFLERRDPYISNMLNVFRVSKLKDLKERARIHVAKGAFLLGMLDETDSLEEGEIYVRVADTANDATSRRRPPIVGPCVIFRNPCFHPGDVRTVIAVDCPKLRHLYDVVVFSAKGFRDLPSMLSGGDLDGDDYTVIWDETLLPPKANYSPFSYKSEDPIQVDQVKIGHIQKFFVNYINNDNLGQIANSHLAISDKSPMGAMDGRCVRLAQLHSLAVDFPKTGRPARFDDDLRARMFPDFMQKQDKRSYQSDKVLGRIYRYIESSDYEHYREKLLEDSTYDPRVWLAGSEEYIIEARDTQTRYNRDICALMNQYGVYTEAELVSGYVMEWKKRTSTRKSMFEQTTQVVRAVKLMQKSYRKEFLTNIDKKDEPLSKDALELKAAAWYYVTYHPKERLRFQSTETRALFSFPWVAYDYICEIAVRNTHRLVEQSMLDPIPETLIDLHRKDMFADIRIASYTIDSDEDDDDDDDDDDEEEEDDDDDDDDDPDDDDEDADDGELEDSMPTFKISDIKKQLQQKDTQPRVHHAETAAASSSTSTAPNFAPPLGTYVEIGADVTDEQLQQLLTL